MRGPLQRASLRGIALEALKLADGVASMGMDVVALGFPLGQDSLKISKGNVAGNEERQNSRASPRKARLSR